jgi:hypothetical protein
MGGIEFAFFTEGAQERDNISVAALVMVKRRKKKFKGNG